MKGIDIIESMNVKECNSVEAASAVINASHMALLEIHGRALACHCECLGMNAENSWAVCANHVPPYGNDNYQAVMKKWGLINEKGEPLI